MLAINTINKTARTFINIAYPIVEKSKSRKIKKLKKGN